MVVGLLDNESSDLNRFTLVTPKPANGVRLQATLDNQNPTGLPVGAVRNGNEQNFPFRAKQVNIILLIFALLILISWCFSLNDMPSFLLKFFPWGY